MAQLHKGIKKSGIMGFCDPCPGEPKQLFLEYTFNGQEHQVPDSSSPESLLTRVTLPHFLNRRWPMTLTKSWFQRRDTDSEPRSFFHAFSHALAVPGPHTCAGFFF